MNIYYVYQYLNENMEPYYIGRGKDNRWSSRHEGVPVPPKERVRFVETKMTEQAAWDLEIMHIEALGRLDLGKGILLNRTDGGDGGSGAIKSPELRARLSEMSLEREAKKKQEGWEYPESARKTISEMQKGVPKPKEWVDNVAAALNNRTEEEKADWKAKIAATKIGKPRSEETKAKLRAANKGKKLSEETKAKIRATKLAKRKSL